MLYTHICRTTTTTTTATGINFAGARAQNVNVAKRRQAKANPKTKPWLKRPEAGAGQKWVGWWWWPGWDGSESSEGWYGLGQSGSRSMLHLRLKADRNQTEPNWTELSRVELSWVWGKPVYKYSTCTPPICHSTRYPVCLGTHTHPRRRSLFPNPYPDTTHPFGHPQSPYVRVEWIPFLLFAFSSIFFLLFFWASGRPVFICLGQIIKIPSIWIEFNKVFAFWSRMYESQSIQRVANEKSAWNAIVYLSRLSVCFNRKRLDLLHLHWHWQKLKKVARTTCRVLLSTPLPPHATYSLQAFLKPVEEVGLNKTWPLPLHIK